MEFTETERHMIDGAYHKMENGEDITPDEMRLVIMFEQWKTLNSSAAQAQHEAAQAEAQARIEECRKTQETARNALMEQASAMITHYERTCGNVKEE